MGRAQRAPGLDVTRRGLAALDPSHPIHRSAGSSRSLEGLLHEVSDGASTGSELIRRENLAPRPRGEEAEDVRVDRLLDESDRAVAEEEVASAGVEAPIVVGAGPLVVGDVNP